MNLEPAQKNRSDFPNPMEVQIRPEAGFQIQTWFILGFSLRHEQVHSQPLG